MHLVFLHGVPGSGKLTTARAVERLVGYPVFHNHLVVDLLTGFFPFGTDPFVRLREQFWLAVLAEAARAGRSLVFTFTPEPTVGAGFPARAAATVTEAGGRVCFVRLQVSEEEQVRRIGLPDRQEFHKLRDATRLVRGGASVEQPPVDLEIDTEVSAPEASAARIVEHFGLPHHAPSPRYP